MKKIIVPTFSLCILVFTSACTTSLLKIHSNPSGAEVYARPLGGGDFQLLGLTPVQMKSEDFDERFGELTGAAYIEIRKDGFKTDQFFVTEISRIDLSINKDLQPKLDLEMQYWLNQQVSGMFEVRRLVDAKRYNEALLLVRDIKKETPMVSTVHQMEAGILLLKGDYRGALDAYRLAFKYDSESLEAVKMVKYLEKTYGFPKQLDISEVKLSPARQPTSENKKEAGGNE